MDFRAATVRILWCNAALLVAWDIVAYHYGGAYATISRTLYDGAKAYPGLAIMIGGLLGHLFFSQTLLSGKP